MDKDKDELFVISLKVNLKLLKAIKAHAYEQDRTVSSSLRRMVERELGVQRLKPKVKPKTAAKVAPKKAAPKKAAPKKSIIKQLKIE